MAVVVAAGSSRLCMGTAFVCIAVMTFGGKGARKGVSECVREGQRGRDGVRRSRGWRNGYTWQVYVTIVKWPL